jgi:hypothetical protein
MHIMEGSDKTCNGLRTDERVGSEVFKMEEEVNCDQSGSLEAKPTWRALEKILQQQQYRCALTGRELTPNNVALDHKISAKAGGQHVMKNCHFVHEQVNRSKNTLSVDEFVALCREVVAWADRISSAAEPVTPPHCAYCDSKSSRATRPQSRGRAP